MFIRAASFLGKTKFLGVFKGLAFGFLKKTENKYG